VLSIWDRETTMGSGSRFSLVFGSGCTSGTSVEIDPGRFPTAKMAGSMNAGLGGGI